MAMNNDITFYIDSDIAAIKRFDKDIQKTYVYIARRIYELKESENLSRVDYKGYKDIYDLCFNEFGYESSKVRYLISIYLKFFKESLDKFERTRFEEFSISQLRYMCEMSDEQIERCEPEMTVHEIKLIKLNNVGTRVPATTIENTDLLKNNNVIEGVFPEQKEIVPEEKVTTIIVTELPKEPIKENKTITVNVKTEQNDDYATNQELLAESHDDYYKKEYLKALDLKNKADIEIIKLNSQIDKLKDKNKELLDIMSYFYDELVKVVVVDSNVKLQSFAMEFSEYVSNNKLPKKVNFFKNVI